MQRLFYSMIKSKKKKFRNANSWSILVGLYCFNSGSSNWYGGGGGKKRKQCVSWAVTSLTFKVSRVIDFKYFAQLNSRKLEFKFKVITPGTQREKKLYLNSEGRYLISARWVKSFGQRYPFQSEYKCKKDIFAESTWLIFPDKKKNKLREVQHVFTNNEKLDFSLVSFLRWKENKAFRFFFPAVEKKKKYYNADSAEKISAK